MPSDRERDAIELLDRIYGRKADHQLNDAGMVEEWVDEQIMAFIRKHGSFAELLSAAATARPDWEAIAREAKPLVSAAPFSSGVMRARRDKWLRAFEAASLGEGSEEAESQ